QESRSVKLFSFPSICSSERSSADTERVRWRSSGSKLMENISEKSVSALPGLWSISSMSESLWWKEPSPYTDFPGELAFGLVCEEMPESESGSSAIRSCLSNASPGDRL
uniref:Uncharacterized protein n=1 Tax=Takifugu rubripes TaxID=31033 RepID=A0A674NEC5_TAKRU